jgi:hypothetical protein
MRNGSPNVIESTVFLSHLYVYPIKSCAGIALDEATVGPRGILHDREWMIVRPDGVFLTQRELPRLALIVPRLDGVHLALEAPGMPPVLVRAEDEGAALEVVVWRDRCLAKDAGAEVARWLTDFLEAPCRLVHMPPSTVRPVDPAYAAPTDQVGFADGFPLLLAAEESLVDLNARLPEPIPMNRFRPNLVIRGAEPFAEDTWTVIRIGGLTFRVAKACARCVTTTVDQSIGVKDGKEPLATLATYRQSPRGVLFGQNLIHDAPGVLRVGDRVEVLRHGQAELARILPTALV